MGYEKDIFGSFAYDFVSAGSAQPIWVGKEQPI